MHYASHIKRICFEFTVNIVTRTRHKTRKRWTTPTESRHHLGKPLIILTSTPLPSIPHSLSSSGAYWSSIRLRLVGSRGPPSPSHSVSIEVESPSVSVSTWRGQRRRPVVRKRCRRQAGRGDKKGDYLRTRISRKRHQLGLEVRQITGQLQNIVNIFM